MYVHFIVVIFLIAFSEVSAQNYKIGDTLHVVDLDGVTLRKSPDLHGKKRGTLANGQQVVVMETAGANADIIDDFEGRWIRVSSLRNKGMKGYVFDAFLSHFPVIFSFSVLDDFTNNTYRWEEDVMHDYLPAILEEYIVRTFSILDTVHTTTNHEYGEGALRLETTLLNHGAKMIKLYPSEGHGVQLELPGARVSEVYFLVQNLLKRLPRTTISLNETWLKFPNNKDDCMGTGDYACTVRVIRRDDGTMLVTFFNACC